MDSRNIFLLLLYCLVSTIIVSSINFWHKIGSVHNYMQVWILSLAHPVECTRTYPLQLSTVWYQSLYERHCQHLSLWYSQGGVATAKMLVTPFLLSHVPTYAIWSHSMCKYTIMCHNIIIKNNLKNNFNKHGRRCMDVCVCVYLFTEFKSKMI